MIQELTSKFKTRYSKLFQDLNSKIYLAPISKVGDKEVFEIPKIELEGGTTGVANSNATFKDIGRPHVVKTTITQVVPADTSIRANISTNDCLNALKDDRYFNFLFDSVMDNLVKEYAKSIGPYDAVRWGQSYLEFKEIKEIDPEPGFMDGYQIVLKGKIATKEEFKG